jgi:hypothetical protein
MFTPVFKIFLQTMSPHLMGALTLILANSFMHCIIKILGIGFSLVLNNVKGQSAVSNQQSVISSQLLANG